MERSKLILIMMPVALLLATFMFVAAVLTACTADTPLVAPADDEPVPISITLVDETPADRGDAAPATRGGWNNITDAYVIAFNEAGERVKSGYFTNTAAVSLFVIPGTYSVYALGNVGSDAPFKNIDKLDKLRSLQDSIATWNGITAGNIVMTGAATGVVAREDGTTTCNIALRRIAAKLVLTVLVHPDDDAHITVSDITLRNIPARTYHLLREMPTEADDADANTGRYDGDAVRADNPAHWLHSANLKSSAAGDTLVNKQTCYLFENRAGYNSRITGPRQKTAANAPDDACTYLEIKGKADRAVDITWRVYLGANPVDNFNIKRNCTYNVVVSLFKHAADARIEMVPFSEGDYDVEGHLNSKSGYRFDWELEDDGAPSGAWAGCNIYWNGTTLTFDGAADLSHQDYMGVRFKWGSLVGISPVGTWSGNVVVYVPAYNGSAESGAAKPAWYSGAASGKNGYDTWANIPYVETSYSDNQEYQRLYVGRNDNDRLAQWGAYKGDICEYLGAIGAAPSGYRMPTALEFGVAGDYTLSGTRADYDTDKADGTGSFTGLRMAIKNGATHFPAAGARNTNGTLLNVGNNGYYWSGSAKDATNSYYLYFTTGVAPQSSNYRYTARPVRCIKN
ncbi:MAG: DUF4906 domain-containing protein [Prevotellaceae bacterium]|nr:DUF4906 domain-containing protein [Prevotellaceae bacterium]